MKYQQKAPTIDVYHLPANCNVTLYYPRQIAEDDPVTYTGSAKEGSMLVIDEYGSFSLSTEDGLKERGYFRVAEPSPHSKQTT